MSKDLFSSRTPFEKCYLVENVKHLSFIPGNRTLRTAHVNRIFKAFLDGEWMPPIYVSADGEVLDGQNRLTAFRMLKEKYPQNKTAIRVIIINSDASPLNLAIKFNAGHANWVITDYMKAYLEKGLHGYQQLQDFTKAFPEFERNQITISVMHELNSLDNIYRVEAGMQKIPAEVFDNYCIEVMNHYKGQIRSIFYDPLENPRIKIRWVN